MNVGQLTSYYRLLATYNSGSASSTAASAASATSATTSTATSTASSTTTGSTTASAKTDSVTVSAAANSASKLSSLETSLYQLRGLADLASRGGLSADFKAELNTQAKSIASGIDGSLSEGKSKLSDLIDLSDPTKAIKARDLADEGLKAVADKRVELGLGASASDSASASDKAAQKSAEANAAYQLAQTKGEWSVNQFSSLLGSLSSSSAASSFEKLYSILNTSGT